MIPTAIMTDTITIKSSTGDTAYGPIWTTQNNVKCYFEAGFKHVSNAHGEEIVASAFCIISPSIVVGIGDFVSHGKDDYQIILVQKYTVAGVSNHQEITLESIGIGQNIAS
jgi:hypothetical protein